MGVKDPVAPKYPNGVSFSKNAFFWCFFSPEMMFFYNTMTSNAILQVF